MKKAIFAWSGGKDSSLALHQILEDNEFEIVGLLTTINEEFQRISMHGVRVELLEKQAASIGLPLIKMFVNEGSYDEYERKMETLLLEHKSEGVTHVIFGDIFLEDLKKYREDNLAKVDMIGVFPLWKRDTASLVSEFISKGFKTVVCCVNDALLGEDHVGEVINESFVSSLPKEVDPCGENGEFHTFCFEGPIFSEPIKYALGEKIYKPLDKALISEDMTTKGFWYIDLS